MTDKKLSASVWVAILGAAVPIILAMATMFGRNMTLLHEHEVRITNVEGGQRLLVDEHLKANTARRNISERISRIEGRLEVVPPVETDDRGHR